MARLRIFVSSTYYDLRHIRSSMKGFLDGMGYEAVLFESGGIPFHHDITLANACYAEVQTCHMLVLIIGGRYGSAEEKRKAQADKDEIQKMYEVYNSVTKKEYETARDKKIPIFIFVDHGVKSEFETYKSNRENDSIQYAHVDSVNIFRLLEDILSQTNNNYVKEFDKFEDISAWLKDQWAGIFADLISNKREQVEIKSMSDRIAELSELTESLKSYTETIMKEVIPQSAIAAIDAQTKREHTKKMMRFKREPIVDYIRAQSGFREGTTIPTIEQLYSALEESRDVEDFLRKADVDADVIKTIMKYPNDAVSAIKILKDKYGTPTE